MVIEITAEDFLVIEEVLLACLPPDGASVTHLKTEAALPCCWNVTLRCGDKMYFLSFSTLTAFFTHVFLAWFWMDAHFYYCKQRAKVALVIVKDKMWWKRRTYNLSLLVFFLHLLLIWPVCKTDNMSFLLSYLPFMQPLKYHVYSNLKVMFRGFYQHCLSRFKLK